MINPSPAAPATCDVDQGTDPGCSRARRAGRLRHRYVPRLGDTARPVESRVVAVIPSDAGRCLRKGRPMSTFWWIVIIAAILVAGLLYLRYRRLRDR